MVTTVCLLSWVLATAQPAPPPAAGGRAGEPPARWEPVPGSPREAAASWLLAPKLAESQEVVYAGTFTEQAAGPNVQFSRSYRLESRLFVLSAAPEALDVAVLTVLKD